MEFPEMHRSRSRVYANAQHAMAELNSAVFSVLEASGNGGLRNADIGRALGIYTGHEGHEGHEGHISRTLLAIMEAEGVVVQDSETKLWRLAKLSGLGTSPG